MWGIFDSKIDGANAASLTIRRSKAKMNKRFPGLLGTGEDVSRWSGKYVIGLTGNIATGKSVVRKMLESLGAYGIDADALSHRVIARGAPGYLPVLRLFGRWLLDDTDEIDRARLGRLVFSDPLALSRLEGIIHPFVDQAVDLLIRRARHRVIVIEAIKLLESGLASACDSLWSTFAPEPVQVQRLVDKRGMSQEEALQRIRLQPSQDEKIRKANVVIRNIGSAENTWKQVQQAWNQIPVTSAETPAAQVTVQGGFEILRGRPGDSAGIVALIQRLAPGAEVPSIEQVRAEFGDKAFFLLKYNGSLVGMAAWQVENLVTRLTDLHLDPSVPMPEAVNALVREVEKASQDLQSEACLVFTRPQGNGWQAMWQSLGYETRTPQSLGIKAWEDAARESMPEGNLMFFKQLRKDRILRPI